MYYHESYGKKLPHVKLEDTSKTDMTIQQTVVGNTNQRNQIQTNTLLNSKTKFQPSVTYAI